MDLVSRLLAATDALPAAALWATAALAALLAGLPGPGRRLPAGLVLALLAVLADGGPAVLGLLAAAVLGGLAGDRLGHRRGRSRPTAARDVAVLARHGGAAVFWTRLAPVDRSAPAAAAGAAGVPYRAVLVPALAGGLAGAVLHVGIGRLLRAALETPPVFPGAADAALVVVTAAVLGCVATALLRRRPVVGEARTDAAAAAVTAAVDAAPASRSERVRALHAQLVRDEWRTLPNAISGLRILLLPVFAVLMARQSFPAALLVLVVVLGSDALDGMVARRTGTTSALGTWLDPLADRLTVVVVVGSFVLAQVLAWQGFALLMVPDIALALVSAVVFRGNPALTVTRTAKARTVALSAGLVLVLLGLAWPFVSTVAVGAGFALSALGVVGHYAAGTQYARGLLRRWQDRAVPAGPTRG